MGPERDQNQKTLEFANMEDQPVWAKKMEERLTAKFDEVTESVSMLDQRVAEVERKAEEKIRKLEDCLNEFEFHQRKYNLIFFGLPTTDRPAEEKVRAFLREDLELDGVDAMPFQHCHPLPAKDGRGQPIIVRFGRFNDKETVLKNLKTLKGKNKKITVTTDLPRQQRDLRRSLREKAKTLRDTGKFVRVIERGREIRLEQKVDGRWRLLDEN
jgi:hypothetical protein